MAKFKIHINDNKTLEMLLQQIYDEVDSLVYQTQTELNKIVNSTNLVDEVLDSKAKYGKMVNDLLATKNKAISTKLDISKLMSEIIKFNGDINKAINENKATQSLNFDELKKKISESMDTDKTQNYKFKK